MEMETERELAGETEIEERFKQADATAIAACCLSCCYGGY